MCTGRVDMEFVLRAFADGMDGVFVGGCKLNECNYITHGNYQALNMVLLFKRIMDHVGLNPDRLRIEFMSAGDGIRFAEVVNDFVKKVKEIGPLGKAEGISESDLKTRLAEVDKLIPYIKVLKNEKIGTRLLKREDEANFFTRDEVEEIFNDVVSYYIDPRKCQACGTCLRKCPVEAITGGKNIAHQIDQDLCIKCGTCIASCPPKFSAIKKIVHEPVPGPLPEDKRAVVRPAKAA
jgi:F420-non-reducing hydrogenase iron-sulfur subunit